MLSSAALLAGCGQKQEPAVPPQPQAAQTPPPADPKNPEPAAEFTDADTQKQYVAHFREYLTRFAPPENGASIWLTLNDGGLVLGTVEKIEQTADGDTIFIKTAHHTAKLPSSFLNDESRSRVFLADFARRHAMARVRGQPVESGAPVEKPFVRHPMRDGIAPRAGPGTHYRRIDSVAFAHDTALTICAESGGWIEVKNESKDVHQWIPRFESYDMDELNPEARQRDLDVLTKTGIAMKIVPESNELHVEPGMWSTLNADERQGIARSMAAYCAATQKKTTIFLTVLDANSSSRLGKYSSSRGWSETAP